MNLYLSNFHLRSSLEMRHPLTPRRYVDPVMARVIAELVIHKPANPAVAMLDYFKWRQAGEPALEDPSVMFKLKRVTEKGDR
jgi:hypothetical protein